MGDAELVGELRGLTVFDLDGTLIDSRRDLAAAANDLIVERGGQPLPETDIGRMVGEGAAVLVRRALTAAGLAFVEDDVARFLQRYESRLLETTVLYPGITEVLEHLASGGPVAVLTNKPLAPSRRLVDALGIAPFIAAVIGGDSAFPKKPDPGSLRHLIAEFHATPQQTVMVGDSSVDHQTALRAGTHVCLVRYGFGWETFSPETLRGDEALVDDPRDIPEAIGRLLRA